MLVLLPNGRLPCVAATLTLFFLYEAVINRPRQRSDCDLAQYLLHDNDELSCRDLSALGPFLIRRHETHGPSAEVMDKQIITFCHYMHPTDKLSNVRRASRRILADQCLCHCHCYTANKQSTR